jgi:hypothetical protein
MMFLELLISAMQRTMIEFPAQPVDRQRTLGLWPGEASEARQRGGDVFIHQVVDFERLEVNARKRRITTGGTRLRVTGGLGQAKIREGARQLERGGRME